MAKNKYLKKELQMKALSIALATSLSASNTGIITALGQDFDGADSNVNQDSLGGLVQGDVEAELEDGDVEANLEDSDVEAELEDGDVEAELEDSDVEANLEDGDVEANLEDGDVEANLEDGDVEAELEDGDVEANLEDGDVEANLEDGDVEANLEDGDVEAELEEENLSLEEDLAVPMSISNPTTYDSDITLDMGSITTAMKPGIYEIPVSFTSVNSASGALSGSTGELEITDGGKAYITISLGTYSHNEGILQTFTRYIGDIFLNQGEVSIISGTETRPTKIKLELTDISSDNLIFTHNAYRTNDELKDSNQTATLTMDFSEYEAFPEFGSSATELRPGKYSVDVSLSGGNSVSDALSSNIGLLEVSEDGDTFITIGYQWWSYGTSNWNTYNRLITAIDWSKQNTTQLTSVDNVFNDDDFITSSKFGIANIKADSLDFVYSAKNSSHSQTLSNQTATLSIDYTTADRLPDDLEAPEITIDGYKNGGSVTVEFSEINDLNLPTAVVADNFDDDLEAELVITTKANTTLSDFDSAKAYLKETSSNSITLTYTATDKTGNKSDIFTITFVSRTDSPKLEDGVYEVYTTLGHASTEGSFSAVDPSLDSENGGNRISKVTAENGVYTIEVELGTSTTANITSGLANISSYDGNIYDVEEILSNDGSYTQKLIFKTNYILDYYMINFNSDYGFMISNHNARLTFDWSEILGSPDEEEAPEEELPDGELDDNNDSNNDNFSSSIVNQDGTYAVQVELLQSGNDNTSMGDGAFDGYRTTKVNTANGKYLVEVEVGTIEMSGVEAGISNISSSDPNVTNLKVLESATTANGSPYTSKFSFETESLESAYSINFDIVMSADSTMPQSARLSLDWDTAIDYSLVQLLEEGTFEVPVEMIQSANGNTSMGDPVFDSHRDTKVYNMGEYYIFELEMSPMEFGGITMGVEGIRSTDSDILSLTYEMSTSEDITTGSSEYVSKVVFATKTIKDYYAIDMDLAEHNNTATRLFFDWSEFEKTSDNTNGAPSLDVDVDVDTQAPTISISGYTNGGTVTKFMSDIDNLSLPTAIVTDNVDNDLTASVLIKSSTGTTLSDFNEAKTYLKASAGNSITLTYTAIDKAENTSTFTIIFTSKADASSDNSGGNSGTLTDGIYGSYTELYHSNGNSLSAVDGALNSESGGNRTSKITVENGIYTIEVELGTAGMFGITSGLANITSYDSKIYDIQEELSADGSYTKKLTFKTNEQLDYYMIEFVNDYGDGDLHTYQARLTFDWDNLKDYSNDLAWIQEEATFSVPIKMIQSANDNTSMGDPVFDDNREIKVYNMGTHYIFELEMSPMSLGDITMGVEGIRSKDDDILGLVYETSHSDNINSGSQEYVSKVVFVTQTIKDYYAIDMDLADHNSTNARLHFDWSKLEKTSGDTDNAPDLDKLFAEDRIAPSISIDGYTNGEKVKEPMSMIDELELPIAVVTDNVDKNLEAKLVITKSDGTTLDDFDAGKTYLGAKVGNSITLTYTATDTAENKNTFIITFESREDFENEFELEFKVDTNYSVPVKLLKATEDENSMGNVAFDNYRNAKVIKNNKGVYTVEVNVGTVTISSFTSGIANITCESGSMSNIHEEYSTLENGSEYVSKFTFETTEILENYLIKFDIVGVGMQSARLNLDWGSATEGFTDYDKEAPTIEVEGFTNGYKKLVEQSNIKDLVLPTVTVIDNIDTGLQASILIESNDGTTTFSNFDKAKEYLEASVDNIVVVTYTASDNSGNTSKFTIKFKSIADVVVEENTTYGAYTELYHDSTEGSLSGVDGVLDSENGGNRTSKIIVDENGIYTIEVELGAITKMGVTAGLTSITSYDGKIYDIQQTLSADGSYTEKLTFKTAEKLEHYMIQFTNDYGFTVMTHEAKLTFDWNNLKYYSDDLVWIQEKATFEVPIAMHKENSNDTSMGDPVFNNNRITNVYNMGDYYIFEAEMTPMTFAGLTMGVEGIRSTDSAIEELVYKTAFSDDITAGSQEYVSKVLFKTSTIKDYYSIDMDLSGHNNTEARLYFDWSELAKTSSGTTNAPSLNDYKDVTPPTIKVSGHTNGDTKELYISDIDNLLLPAVTVIDDFDKIIEADVIFKTSAGATLNDFSKAKEYLKETAGNSIIITYTATDKAGNSSIFTIILTSKVDLEFGADIKEYGTFEVPIAMHKENSNEASMGDPVFNDNRITKVYNMGSYYLFEAEMTPMTFAGITMGVEGIRSTDSDITSLLYKIDTSDDITAGSNEYVSKVYFTTHEIKDYYSIDMDLADHNNTEARLYFDWSELEKISSTTTNAPNLDDLFAGDENYTDITPPEISVAGYSNGQEAKVYTSRLNTLSLPTAKSIDNVDGDLEVSITITSATTGNTFNNFDTAKEYLKTDGNTIVVEYKSIDNAGNYSTFTIKFTSIDDIVVEENNNDNDNGEVDIAKNGVYGVETYLYHATNDNPSMGDGALSSDRISIITNSNGTYSFEISLGTVSIATLTGGIGSVKSTDGKLSNIKYDMATDSNGNSILDSSGSEYIEKLYFEATEISEFYNIEIYIPVMENSGNQDARLKFDWDNATLIPSGDQEEEKEEETFYFTFGGENDDAVLIPDGDHEIKVGITTNDNTELGKVVEQVLAEAGTLTVDRTGDGKLTLRFTEKVIINGREYRVKGFRYKNIPTPSAINIFNVFPILSSNATPEIDDITGEVIFDIFDPTAISLDVILDVEYTDDKGNIVEDEVDVELNLGYDNVDGAEDYDDDLVTDREDDENDNTSTPDTTTPDSNTGGDNSDGGNSGNTNTSVDIKNNGNYTVTTYLYHETKDETSMGDGAFSKNRTSKVTNSNGTYSFEVNMSTLTFTGLTGGIGSIKSTDGKLSNITYDIGTDSNGEQYVKKLYFKTKEISDFYDIEIYIPVMGDYGTQQARLYFDWDTLKTSSSGASTGSTSSSSSNSSTTETSTEEEILLEEVDMTINGNYLVPLTLMHESKDQVSMGNGAFEENKYAIVNTQNGTYTVVVQPSTITMSSLTSGIGTLISTDGAMNSLSILERQKLETGDEYISKFQFTTTKFDTEYPIQITVPNSPMGITDARLVLDWENAIKANELASGSSISNAQLLSLLEVSTNTNLPLEVQDESGLTISFDAEALQSILDLAGEEDVVINVKELEDTSTLTQAQQDILSTDAKLYHFEILIGEEAITSLDSGKVTIGLPYTLYAGQEEEALSVSYVDEAGEVKEFDFNYDYKNITVETSLLGLYAVEYDETYTTPEEEQDDSNELDLDSVVLEFNDVSSADWFYDYVKYTYARGIFKGTSDTTFDPYSNATREAFVTVLYRLAGEPNPNTRNEFTDVLSDQYYTNAVVWASENSIVSGYGNNKFGTGDSITREQMVTIMYNFANHMGVDTSSSKDLTSFTDASQISSYAVDAFKWAVAEDIISGNGNDTLTPKNTATRSEISKILTVLAQNYDL